MPRVVVGQPPSWNLRLNWPTPFWTQRFRQISAHSAWTTRASEKCSIITNRKSTIRVPMSHRWTVYVSPKSPKGGWKREFLHIFALPFIFLLQVIVDISNLIRKLIITSLSLRTTKCPWNGRGHVTWSTLNFKALNIPRITEAGIVKFLTHVG